MSIIRVQHNRDYVVMNKTGLEDQRLSFKAKGILAYLLSKPNNWKANIKHLATVSKDGKDAVASGLNELEEYGYLTRKQIRNDDGTIKEWESIITEIPAKSPEPDFPDLDNQEQGYPDQDNPEVISNELKTEEEEIKIPQKIQSKFQQVFNRNLSKEFYQEIIQIYSDPNIILKALSICYQQADKPRYLLVILKDWKNNKLTSITDVITYLENRQAQREVKQSKQQAAAARVETPEEELERLYEAGWQ